MIPFAFFCTWAGMLARAQNPDIIASQSLYYMTSNLGSGFMMVLTVALVATMVSTAPSFLLYSMTALTRDFYVPFFRKDANDKEQVLFSRIAMVIIGGVTVIIGANNTSILHTIMDALQIRAIPGIVLMAALLFWRIDGRAAFWSILSGLVVSLTWYVLKQPFGIGILWPALAVSIPLLIIFTIKAPKKISDGAERYNQAQTGMNLRSYRGIYE
jgi:SSS family solute:Na+ symporter